jgi:Legume lectin domain
MAMKGFMRVATLAAIGLISGVTLASAQSGGCPASPNYSTDFSVVLTNPSCFALNGTNSLGLTGSPSISPPFSASSSVSNVLQLTANQGGWATSSWYTTPQVVTSGFSTTFSFQVGNSSNNSQGDGFAFVIENSGLSALGASGCGIGFGGSDCVSPSGITNSVAIEFNTYQNAGVDPSSDDVTIQNCGGTAGNSVGPTCSLGFKDLSTGSINIADGAVHVATVIYTPSTLTTCGTSQSQACSTLDVILDGTDLFPGGVLFDMTTIGLINSSAYVGFTAGTGDANDTQDILNWTFTPTTQTQTGTVNSGQSTPTTFNFNGGFAANPAIPVGYNFSVLPTNTTLNLSMSVTAIPVTQETCNALVQKNPSFAGAQCFVYQNGASQGHDASVMYEVTCPSTGSCGSTGTNGNPFYADLGTQFNFDCLENVPLQCGPPVQQTLSFGLPNLTPLTNTPLVGFLKGEGPDASHPCVPDSTGVSPLFTSNQIETFALGDTSGGAKGGSGGTTSCWVMTYATPNELPSVSVAQPVNGGKYTQNTNQTASYTCSAVNTGPTVSTPTGPYLTVASCTATDAPGGSVSSGSPFDTATLGTHTFSAYVQDSATNTNLQTVTYTVVAAPVISGPSNGTFAVGTPGLVSFSATGYPVPAFTESGALPAGVTFVDNLNGTATLSGTATTSGIFPITVIAKNTAGSSAALAFTLTTAATVPSASSKCNGVYNGTFKGNLTISAGQTCMFVGGGVTGNIVENGGNLVLTSASVGGSIQANGGTFSVGPGVTIKGNFTMIEIAKSNVQNQLCGATIGGNLTVLGSGTPIAIGSGTTSCPGNSITGSLTVSANNAATSIYNNTVGGSLLDLANFKPTQVFANHVNVILSCLGDVSITGGGNTASVKQGQCSKF